MSREFQRRLKACYESVSDAAKTPRTQEPKCIATRQGMVIGIKLQLAEIADLRKWLDEIAQDIVTCQPAA